MPENEPKSDVLGAQSEWESRKRFASLLSTDIVQVCESGTKDCRFTLSTHDKESGIIVCRLDWNGKWDFTKLFTMFFFNAVRRKVESSGCPSGGWAVEMFKNSSPGLFCFTPRTLENGGEFLKYNLFSQSFVAWVPSIRHSRTILVVVTRCDLICLLVLWTMYYSEYYPVLNW